MTQSRQNSPEPDVSVAPGPGAIGRREFVLRTSGFLVAAGFGIACGDDGTRPSADTGTVRVMISGLEPGFVSAGTAQITGPGINRTVALPGVDSAEAVVPVGTYTVVYTPPAGYAISPGTPNTRSVVVEKDQTTDVNFSVLQATGTLRLLVTGISGGAPDGGSAQVLRTDVGGQTPITVNVPASGTIDTTVEPGTYSVDYTPAAGHHLAVGVTNPQTVVVGEFAIGTATFAIELSPTTGVLRVTVTGLLGSAATGGTAHLLRTDISGQTPVDVVLPANSGTGTADTEVTAGTYQVSYSPPPNHTLADGVTHPVTVDVAVEEIETVTFQVREVTVPGGIVFHSNWSTATGTSAAALLDTGKPLQWDTQIGNGNLNTIVPATANLDFPASMANVMLNVAQFSSNASQRVLTQFNSLLVASQHIPIPQPVNGQRDLYYRWYQRWVVPDSIDTNGGAPHPIQDGPAASQTNWMWEVVINSDGTWLPRFNFANTNSFPNNRWRSPVLPKNHTYRIELHIRRLTSTTFTAAAEIWDDKAGTRVQQSSDFVNGDGSQSLADSPVLNINDPSYFGAFQAGNNGPSWNNNSQSQFPFNLWYLGGVAISTTPLSTSGWIGPYSGGI